MWLTLALIALAAVPLQARAADVPFDVFVDGRRVDAAGKSALERRGLTYVDVVRAVKTFDGLLTFGLHGLVRVSIGPHTLAFTPGRAAASLDGAPLRLPSAPFVKNGDTYVPLRTVAALAGAGLAVDARGRRALLRLGAGDVFALAQPAPTDDGNDEDVLPSPARALSFRTSAAIDESGLHARVDITNTTAQRYAVPFPTRDQVAFVLSRDGREVWASALERHVPEATRLEFAPRDTKTFTADLHALRGLGAGRYMLRVRLLTLIPFDTAPVSLGILTPASAAPH